MNTKTVLTDAEIMKDDTLTTYIYNSGYMSGHQDTVEAQFTDIHSADMGTYHADVVSELVTELRGDSVGLKGGNGAQRAECESVSIRKNIEVEIALTPKELAESFWSMTSEGQEMFFNALGEMTGGLLCFQLQAVTDGKILSQTGRNVMSMIGGYSQESDK